MKLFTLIICFLLGACNLPDRKQPKPKYTVRVVTEFDSTTYLCDNFYEGEDKLVLYRYRSSVSSEADKMIITIKSNNLQYEIKSNQ